MKTDPGIQTVLPWYEGQPELAPCEPEPAPSLPAEMEIDWAELGMIRDIPCRVIL